TANELTGEHSCVMVRALRHTGAADPAWADAFAWDFRRRFVELLGYQLRSFAPPLVLSILEGCEAGRPSDLELVNSLTALRRYVTAFDVRRLDSYAQNLLDYHVVMDLVPILARLYFLGYLSGSVAATSSAMADDEDDDTAASGAAAAAASTGVRLSPVQSALLAATGLQRRTVEESAADLRLPVAQALALFGKTVRKLALYFAAVEEAGAASRVAEERRRAREAADAARAARRRGKAGAKKTGAERAKLAEQEDDEVNGGQEAEESDEKAPRDVMDEEAWDPVQVGLDEDLAADGNAAMRELRERQRALIDSLDLQQL
ncbi:hypothetical protein HK405_001479, partial [Cladochytrium tenue]